MCSAIRPVSIASVSPALTPAASPRIPVAEEVASTIETVRASAWKSGPAAVLADCVKRSPDEGCEPAERDEIVGIQSERGQVEPFGRLKVRRSRKPSIQSLLVKEMFATPSPLPPA